MLVLARVLGGVAAGMAYPTTLALIAALWSGARRTKAIALWSGIGGAVSALGPLLAGAALQRFWWGSVFLLTLAPALLALVLAPSPGAGAAATGLFLIAGAAAVAFVWRQRRAPNPLYDLKVASRRTFLVGGGGRDRSCSVR